MPATKLTDGVVASIAKDHFELGKSIRKIAAERSMSKNTIAKAIKIFREPPPEQKSQTESTREQLEQKAFVAIEAGLDADADPYKRADVGFKYLKGTGVFSDDEARKEVNIHIQNMLAGIPEEWRDRYQRSTDIEVTEVANESGVSLQKDN